MKVNSGDKLSESADMQIRVRQIKYSKSQNPICTRAPSFGIRLVISTAFNHGLSLYCKQGWINANVKLSVNVKIFSLTAQDNIQIKIIQYT